MKKLSRRVKKPHIRNAVYRYLSEKKVWLTANQILDTFQQGDILTVKGQQSYGYSVPRRAADLSFLLKKDERFVSRKTEAAALSHSGPYIIKEWSVAEVAKNE